MNKTNFNKRIKEILNNDDDKLIYLEMDELVKELHDAEDNQKLIQLYMNVKTRTYINSDDRIAFYLLKDSKYDECIEICKNILEKEPKHLQANFLLSNAYLMTNKIELANKIALLLVENYEERDFVIEYYNRVSEIVENLKEEDKIFHDASENLIFENDFVINKLSNFIKSFLNDSDYNSENGTLEIASWKFSQMMRVDNALAESLKNQWLQKKYIIDTKRRGNYAVKIYKINPYLKDKIKEKSQTRINQGWLNSINKINQNYLNNLQYFENRSRLLNVTENYRSKLVEVYDELFINYIFNNKTSVAMLSDDMIYGLLIYYIDHKNISFDSSSDSEFKDLKDLSNVLKSSDFLDIQCLNLVDLISTCYEKTCNSSTYFTQDIMNDRTFEICFNSVLELITKIL